MPNSEKNLRRTLFLEQDLIGKKIKTKAYVLWNALVTHPAAMTNRETKEGIIGVHSARVQSLGGVGPRAGQ